VLKPEKQRIDRLVFPEQWAVEGAQVGRPVGPLLTGRDRWEILLPA
jgi:hypothetical protein